MNHRIETWKRAAPVLKSLAVVLAVAAGTSGTALADEEPSFTRRVQVSLGNGLRSGDQANAAESVNLPLEASSFLARVEASQGIMPDASAGLEGPRAATTSRYSEPESFVTRVAVSQAIRQGVNKS